MKDYPRAFTIKKTGNKWMVRFVRSETMWNIDPDHSEEDPTLGLTVKEDRTIYLLMGQSSAKLWSTFCHELLHVAEFEHGLKIRHATIYRVEPAMAELWADLGFIPW